jgi:tetratricopeptide (TPR) repeat protein
VTACIAVASPAVAASPDGAVSSPPASEVTAPSPLPTGPGKANWAKDYAEARETATKDHKVVYVEFFEKRCGFCQHMDALTYPAVNFEMMLLRMVPVKLDRTVEPGASLAARYGVTESPAVLILSSGGALIFRVNGFDNPPEFYRHVNAQMKEWDKLNVRMIHEPEFRDDPKQEVELGVELALRFDPEEAAPRFERAASSPQADARTRDQALSYLASAQLKTRRYADARASIERLIRLTGDSDLREQAEIFAGQISLEEGDPAAAQRVWKEFIRKHPTSGRRPEVENRLAAISSPAAKGTS